MPEHAKKRDELERRLMVALRRSNERNRLRLMRALGSPPDPRNIPERTWRQVEGDMARTPLPWWRRTWNMAFGAMAVLGGYVLAVTVRRWLRSRDEEARRERAAGDARRRRQSMERRLEKTRQQDQQQRAEDPEADPVDWDDEVRATVGLPKKDQPQDEPSGSEKRQARTGVTIEISKGERAYTDGLELETQEVLAKLWYTERDGRVCPICAPLHRTPEAVWGPVSPGGPPAHPNCRCWLTYRTVSVTASRSGREIA